MLFGSVHFLFFFPLVTFIYYLIPVRYRWVWLLPASYYFYMCWHPAYALVIGFVTAATFIGGKLIANATARTPKKLWLALSILLGAMPLFAFKYLTFAVGAACRALAVLNIHVPPPAFALLLPVGMSFYTLQALGYVIDIYRGKIQPEPCLGRYAMFVSFFPLLVAGPVERSQNLLPQLLRPNRFNAVQVRDGLFMMLWGFFEKMVIANRAAIVANTVFGEWQQHAGLSVLVATLLFSVQIYCDFAGFSHIAIGASRVLGIELTPNFRRPYLAVSLTDFWQRWNISVTSWLHDYLYIPLCGAKKGLSRMLCITAAMLLGGLWYGANWSAVAFGGLHGLYLLMGILTKPLCSNASAKLHLKKDSAALHFLKRLLTFLLVAAAWVVLRAPGLRAAVGMLRSLFSVNAPFSLDVLGLLPTDAFILAGAVIILAIADLVREKHDGIVLLTSQPAPLRWVIYYLLLYGVLRFGLWGAHAPPSNYFQFY